MNLFQLLKNVNFDQVFSEILQFVPDIAFIRDKFMHMCEFLCIIPPDKKETIMVDVFEENYLGEGVINVRLLATEKNISNLSDFGLIKDMVFPLYFSHSSIPPTPITRIIASIIWNLVAMEGMSDISLQNEIHDCEEVAEMIYRVTGFNSPLDKAAYKIICILDDYMWRDEDRTIVYLYSSPGYEQEVEKITEFIMGMIRKPTIVYGTNSLRGIAMKAYFLKNRSCNI